jgi:protocatechuate 3,4-dioxygenase beta subunit
MRRLVLISLLVAVRLGAQPGSAGGVVVDQTGKPIAGVHVRLITVGDPDSSDNNPVVYGAITDKAGQFSVDGLKSGLYFVMAERTGFVQQISRLSPLGLKPGQHLTDYKITMAARALIVGHVIDEYADPVPGVNVQVQPVNPNQPEGFMFGQMQVTTDDRGEFRLITGPGKYYLKAFEPQRFRPPTTEVRTDGTSSAPFTTTFYPSAANTSSAGIIEVAAGQDLAGVDIHLLRTGPGAARGFTISGVVIGAPDNGRANVMLHYGESAGQYNNGRGTTAGEDGKFSFPGMQPGYYSVAASYRSGKTPLQSHSFEFHIESADETGVQLTLAPAEELTGKLEVVGDAPAGQVEKRTARLEPAGNQFGQGDPLVAEVHADGSFQIGGVPPGKFKALVEPMPENGYLKEVTLDGKAVPDEVLDFTQGVGGSRLKITVSRNGAQISGNVLGKDGEPLIGLVMVLFGTDAKHLNDENQPMVRDGKYSFKGVRPGKYRIVAVDLAEMMPLFTGDGDNDKMMQQLFDLGEEIEAKDGDRIAKDLPVLTKMPEKKENR